MKVQLCYCYSIVINADSYTCASSAMVHACASMRMPISDGEEFQRSIFANDRSTKFRHVSIAMMMCARFPVL